MRRISELFRSPTAGAGDWFPQLARRVSPEGDAILPSGPVDPLHDSRSPQSLKSSNVRLHELFRIATRLELGSSDLEK
jgi:hypothetical protein